MRKTFDNILSEACKTTQDALSSVKEPEVKVEPKPEAGWGVVEGKNRAYSLKPSAQWNTTDLFLFFLDTFRKVTGLDFDTGIRAGQQGILYIQDAMAKVLGVRPTQEQVRDYIEWFLGNKAMTIITKYNCFKMKFLNAHYNIEEFVELRGSRPVAQSQEPKNQSKKANVYTQSVLESVYLVSDENFLLRYGIVLSIAWLIKGKKMTEVDAIAEVRRLCIEASKHDRFDDLVKATEKHSPYPLWCKFAGLKKLLADLTTDTSEFFDIIHILYTKPGTGFGVDGLSLGFFDKE